MPRRYAAETNVSIAQSRGEIEKLLRQWGADGISWTDQYVQGLAKIEFIWQFEGTHYLARITFKVPKRADFLESGEGLDNRSGKVSEIKLSRLLDQAGRAEHRCLLLLLKAAFNAVDQGMIRPEQLFLAFLVDGDGQTVGDVMIPRLNKMLAGGAARLLPSSVG